jgi:RNA polymerase sigma-70 factor, ECF subfamily
VSSDTRRVSGRIPRKKKAEAGADAGELWKELAGPLERFIARRVGNHQDAEDLLQEVFLRAHIALDGVEDKRRVRPWLYRIASNAIADHHRRKRLPTRPGIPHGIPDEPAEEETSPENLNGEVSSCLPSVVRELPEKYRRALTLADLEGRTQREVAEELGLSPSGAKSRVQRARKRLKAILQSCCRFELDRLGNVLGYAPRGRTCRHCSC